MTLPRPAPLLLLLASACTKAEGDDTAVDDTAVDDTAASDQRTLESCVTAIDDDAPAFFRAFFACVTIEVNGDDVVITSDGQPPHPSAYYPDDDPNHVPFDTSGGRRQNPNRIAPQSINVTVPSDPTSRGLTIDGTLVDTTALTSEYEYRLGPQGLALNGVALFNAAAAPGDQLADEAFTFDAYEGHPENSGVYHYHTASPGPLEVLVHRGLSASPEPGAGELEVYGVMCDGTVVLGCDELDGPVADLGALDAQAGHVDDIVGADGTVYFEQRYHTHVCPTRDASHPYTPEIQFYDDCRATDR